MIATLQQELLDTMTLAPVHLPQKPEPGFSPGTVMLVSQNEVEQRTLSQFLERAGYHLIVVGDSQSALLRLGEVKPEVVLIHASDSLNLCKQIRQLPKGSDIAIFILSDAGDTTSIEAALDAGINDYLTYPLQFPLLRHRLSQHFTNVRSRQALQDYASELEARNEELEAYSYTIAHDLKQPLNFISTLTALIELDEADGMSAESIEGISKIQQQAQRMGRMIDQLLWVAQLQHSSEIVQEVDMREVVDQALERFDSTLTEHRIEVRVERTLPAVMGHPQLLEEVLANLISNAVKYIGDNAPRRISIHAVSQGNHVRYEVADTGIGISTGDQLRLFKMFSRIKSQGHSGAGLGLGLAIVHRLITRLNGQVGVESTPGQGSTFWFTLPAAVPVFRG